MHKHFADWYRDAKIEPTADQLERRWKAIEAFAKPRKGRIEKAVELNRLFFLIPTADPEFTTSFREAFQSADQAFPMRGNDFELRLLAGATLASMIDQGTSDERNMTALASLASWCQGLREDLPFGDLPRIAETHLLSEASRLRGATEPPAVKPTTLNIDEKVSAIQTALSQGQVPPAADPLSQVLTDITTSASATGKSADAILNWLIRNLRLQQEETNILWWLFSESSRDLDQPFSGLPGPFASLVAGVEIADMVLVVPGPVAIRAFVHRALKNANPEMPEKGTIREAVSDAPASWIGSIAGRSSRDFEDILPIHSAIRASAESDGAKGSIKLIEKRINVKVNAGIALESLGLQIYYERLFLSVLDGRG